ncbi:DUF1491 family protein [Ahrensia kielensis]|uniref:DUF1491 family protein n=1 Tax=Ahrensia kielensis TaxID=76980 RepID=A0ABU9T8A1_9HYPH|nr:DUF1491 family protein [Ahrensia sp. 13_GOM-1096m]
MARLASSIVISAITRMASLHQGAAYIRRRGADGAGAIFITLYDVETRSYCLYEPVPQFVASDEELDRDSRAFSLLAEGQTDFDLNERFIREERFDPDFWVVDIEGVSAQVLKETVLIV